MNNVLMMMIGVSLFALFLAICALLWGIKNKQFDDDYKFTILNDSEEALNDAIILENRKKNILKDRENQNSHKAV
ncbi:cbb3-type cytochrome oxidase assembly protein CcoS [Campylobacter insulaenigrae]|uniref:Cytochrome oxidase maturation protein, cbb3-type n=2 Tax=Campylobacter insulaenigrae TaxID=260714 RepID=A0A0A8H037_9BACT|nr:cbb3-type cytochrome oxidase assembly protein CcoS [Campylobacter insulaenigrae]AJC87518.1 cytochrome oxidase maturation protein, cbb3-type [Campylobacter insulaenigrae NCTC 12927]MCR6571071.1 cbb3-type cytochrome oxidase assembly protein CcoS [Campylobacter insulaenigrae]MCR6572946.1 cbb3-type cytochrome oxidase assembly protein CcoS [Campylobacter insulaenigrae]MCR6574206.1 cbb3-type cytochrome oxidase assembly protein CcoS [Campylobacter insulaenigrae]MCR6575821.1 cbb3-type cytochrome ox